MARKTKTSSFGASKRETHDASAFYGRNLYTDTGNGGQGAVDSATSDGKGAVDSVEPDGKQAPCEPVGNVAVNSDVVTAGLADDGIANADSAEKTAANTGLVNESADFSTLLAHLFDTKLIEPRRPVKHVAPRPPDEWADRIYCHTSEDMHHVPDASVALAFTSPPYNVGKDYDLDMSLVEYLDLITRVAAEVHRVLRPGGRYVVNIANLGRKPYIPLHALFYARHMAVGFLPAGEIIWQKGKGASGSCAWGSWMSAKAPRLRDLHEYLLVFCKEDFDRPDRGESDIGRDEFMASTLSIWEVPPESARRIGHPAPFPVELAQRVIRLYSYVDDVVLDPFNGSGSTSIAARDNNRRFVGYEIEPDYCKLAQSRLGQPITGSLFGQL